MTDAESSLPLLSFLRDATLHRGLAREFEITYRIVTLQRVSATSRSTGHRGVNFQGAAPTREGCQVRVIQYFNTRRVRSRSCDSVK